MALVRRRLWLVRGKRAIREWAHQLSGTGALQWGAGADFTTPFKIIFPISLRGEVRDFYTLDTLNFNNPLARTTQHNVVAGGGFFWRF